MKPSCMIHNPMPSMGFPRDTERFISLSFTPENYASSLRFNMCSKFWPKGGLPSILHHYVCTFFLGSHGRSSQDAGCRQRLSSHLNILPAPFVNLTVLSFLEAWAMASQQRLIHRTRMIANGMVALYFKSYILISIVGSWTPRQRHR